MHLREERATVFVGGRPVEDRLGDTIAAALVDVGELTCRIGARGERRGVFCGMGVCHDCVMVVDAKPVRTCLAPVRDGMRVEIEQEALLPKATSPRLEPATLEPDVVVVGAGPGGLAAAAAA